MPLGQRGGAACRAQAHGACGRVVIASDVAHGGFTRGGEAEHVLAHHKTRGDGHVGGGQPEAVIVGHGDGVVDGFGGFVFGVGQCAGVGQDRCVVDGGHVEGDGVGHWVFVDARAAVQHFEHEVGVSVAVGIGGRQKHELACGQVGHRDKLVHRDGDAVVFEGAQAGDARDFDARHGVTGRGVVTKIRGGQSKADVFAGRYGFVCTRWQLGGQLQCGRVDHADVGFGGLRLHVDDQGAVHQSLRGNACEAEHAALLHHSGHIGAGAIFVPDHQGQDIVNFQGGGQSVEADLVGPVDGTVGDQDGIEFRHAFEFKWGIDRQVVHFARRHQVGPWLEHADVGHQCFVTAELVHQRDDRGGVALFVGDQDADFGSRWRPDDAPQDAQGAIFVVDDRQLQAGCASRTRGNGWVVECLVWVCHGVFRQLRLLNRYSRSVNSEPIK